MIGLQVVLRTGHIAVLLHFVLPWVGSLHHNVGESGMRYVAMDKEPERMARYKFFKVALPVVK